MITWRVGVASLKCFHSISAMRVTILSNSSSGISAHVGRRRSAISRLIDSREFGSLGMARRTLLGSEPSTPGASDGALVRAATVGAPSDELRLVRHCYPLPAERYSPSAANAGTGSLA